VEIRSAPLTSILAENPVTGTFTLAMARELPATLISWARAERMTDGFTVAAVAA